MKIFCFGDSITYGESDPKYGGWVDRLKVNFQNRYQEQFRQECFVYNLGIGGETTDGLANRMANEIEARSFKIEKNIVLLAYGSNDIVIHKNKNKVPIEYFRRNYTNCIQWCHSRSYKVILLNLLPLVNKNDGKIDQHGNLRHSADVLKYNQELINIANDFSCLHIDINAEFSDRRHEDIYAFDGVHPNTRGHEIIYNLVELKLENISLMD